MMALHSRLILLYFFAAFIPKTDAAPNHDILNAQGTVVGSIQTSSPSYILENSNYLYRRANKSGKVSYIDGGNSLQYSVKQNDKQLKLKNDQALTIFKVKFKTEGLKIAFTDDMQNPFYLHPTKNGCTLKQNGEILANGIRENSQTTLKINNRVEFTSDVLPGKFICVLAISKKPLAERLILLNELLQNP